MGMRWIHLKYYQYLSVILDGTSRQSRSVKSSKRSTGFGSACSPEIFGRVLWEAMEGSQGSQGSTSHVRHDYDTKWPAYSLAWSCRPEAGFRFAVGSCIEETKNFIQIVELNEEKSTLECVAETEHSFPPTKLLWRPDNGSDSGKQDLLASSTTTLNLWKVEDGQMKCVAKLANTRAQKQSTNLPPLTSFDWSSVSHHKLGASSVDTTCTIWNLEKQKIETQLIAHDKAVYDIAFSHVDSLFASVGARGRRLSESFWPEKLGPLHHHLRILSTISPLEIGMEQDQHQSHCNHCNGCSWCKPDWHQKTVSCFGSTVL